MTAKAHWRSILFILVLTLPWLFPLATMAETLSAPQVMERVDNRNDGDTAIFQMTMVLISKNDHQRIRQIKSFRRDDGNDTKSMIVFLSPADVRDTAYLSYEWDDDAKEDDAWLYLPALRKVKRIAGGEESSSFMGSDFSYADINGLEISDWDYTFVQESETVEGQDAWVIQGIPKAEKKTRIIEETGYLKIKQWVRKDNFMIVKAKYWVSKGRKIKYFTAKEIRQIDGIWTALEMNMVTTSRGKREHASVIRINKAEYDSVLPASHFTTQAMERGL